MDYEIRPCRYPVAEMVSFGAFKGIGHLTAAVPPDASVITLLTPATRDRPVQAMSVLVFRKGTRPHYDNDDDVAFLGIVDRATVLDHPAFEPMEGLATTNTNPEPS